MSGLSWCKNHKKLLCIDCLGVVLAVVLSIFMQHIIDQQYSQQQADRWQAGGEIRYHQVSAFLQGECGMNKEGIMRVRSQIQSKLLEAGYAQDSVTGRLWVDSYMALADDSVSKTSELGTSGVERVHIMGVGGDFFYFHPLDLMAGSFFADGDISQDKVLIDQETAWALYGGVDIAGKTIEIAGQTFVISGVYRASENKTEHLARGKVNYIFMDYDMFHSLYGDKNILCYEATLPNPVKGFALQTLKIGMDESEDELYEDDVSISFSDKSYVDNTDRFTTWKLIKKLVSLPNLLMRTTQISYPYWENSVRALEFRLEVLLLWQIISLIFPVITVCQLLIVTGRQIKGFFKANLPLYRDAVLEKWNEHERKRKEKKQVEEGD